MFERLLDKNTEPSFSELECYCGENKERFIELNKYLSEQFFTLQEIRFPYGKSYGWCVTHRRDKKLICDIFAEAGAYTVMLRLTDAQFMAIYSELKEYTQKYIDNRYPCKNGGWIHYRVISDDNLYDIKCLLNAKCK